jgi:hypothetical protein
MSPEIHEKIQATIQQAVSGRHRLVLVVGDVGSGKTAFLRSVAAARGMQFISLGEPLGVRLLEVAPRTRPLAIEETVRGLVSDSPSGAAIDDTDVLFDPALRCDPLRLACSVSQNLLVLFSLTGRIEGRRFVRGYSDHPEFYSEEFPSVPLIVLDRTGPTFHAS